MKSLLLLGLVSSPLCLGGASHPASLEEEVKGLRPAPEYDHAAVTERLIRLGREENEAMTHLRVLTKDIGPRMTSSQGLIEAQAWARYTFERWGLEAWLEEWGTFPVGFDRGPSRGTLFAPEPVELAFITMAWTPGTPGPLRGKAILEPRTEEEVDALGDELKGAWIVRRAERRPRSSVRSHLEEKASAAGAHGFIRRAGGTELLVTGGNHKVDWEDLPTTVTVHLRSDQYDELVEAVEQEGSDVELEFDIQNYFRKGPIAQHNVIADIEGTEKPDEYVIIQAHIDSWDGAEGAADNGTGTSITMEAARLLMEAGVRPRRTIRFVLYSGEEQGLFGSKGYVDGHTDEHERISVVFNHDHGTQPITGVGVTEPMVADFEQCFAEVMELDPERPFEIRVVDGLRPGPSDHAPFVSAGIPGFFWDQSQEGYRTIHHTQHDTYERVQADDVRFSALVVALAAHNFANLDHLVDRTDMKAPDPRRMGVFLDDSGVGVQSVVDGGRAALAGWQKDDKILEIDGVAVENRRDVVRELREGGPLKTFVLQRGEERIETVLDYSDDPDEPARQRQRAARERERAEREARRREREDDEEPADENGDDG